MSNRGIDRGTRARWQGRTGVAAFALAAVASSCVTTFEDFARDLRAIDVRSFVAEDDFMILSPYPPRETSSYLMHGRTGKQALEANLGVTIDEPIVMVLEQRPAGDFQMVIEDGVFKVSGTYRKPSQNGVQGMAYGTEDGSHVIKLYVGTFQVGYHEDGRRIDGINGSADEGLIVHELAHRYAAVLGLTGSIWFSEGFALYFQFCQIEALAMTPVQAPEILARLAHSPSEWRLSDLFDWKENIHAIHDGDEVGWDLGRPLAYSWVRFLLETHVVEGTLRERLTAIHSMGRAEALELEASWKAWLRAYLSEHFAVDVEMNPE